MTINVSGNAIKQFCLTAILLCSIGLAQQDQQPGTFSNLTSQSRPLDADTQKILDQAQAALKAGQNNAAVKGFEAVVAKDFSNYSAHFGLGLALYRLGDLRGAAFEFTQLTVLDASRFEGWFNLGVVRDRLGLAGDASTAFAKAVEVGQKADLGAEDMKPAYLGQVRALRTQNQYDSAAAVLKAALEKIPGDTELSTLLADSLVRGGKGLDALPVLYDLLAKDPANVGLVSQIADIYVDQQLPNRAIRELDRGIEASKDSAGKAQLLLKKSTLLQGRDQQAALQEAARMDSKNWAVHYNLAVSRLRDGNLKGALESFQNAYAQNPDEPKVALGLANTYDRLGQTAESGRFAAIAAKSSQGADHLEALYLQGKASYSQRQYADAVEALSQVTSAQADRADGWFYLGVAQFNLKKYSEASAALEKAQALQPSATTAANLGAAYFAAGRYPEAQKVLFQAVTLDARNAIAWYNLGLAYRALGQQPDAKKALQRSADLGYAPAKDLLK